MQEFVATQQPTRKNNRKLVTLRHRGGVMTFYSDAYDVGISHNSLDDNYSLTINRDITLKMTTYRAAKVMLDTIANTIADSSKYDEDTIDITLPNIITLPLTQSIDTVRAKTDEDFEEWYKYYTEACVNTIIGYIFGDTTAVCDMAYYMESHSYELVLYISDCDTFIANTCFIYQLTDGNNDNIPVPGDILTTLSDKFNLEYDIYCTAGLIRLDSEIYEKYNKHSKEYFKDRIMNQPGMTLHSIENRIAYDMID